MLGNKVASTVAAIAGQDHVALPLAKVTLPTEDEFPRLLEIVLIRYPQLRPRDTQGFEQEFCLAFQFLQHTGRREKLDRDHRLLFWIDTAAAWLRERKIAPGVLGIGAMAFVAAAIASGDILYTSPDEFPHIAFGLVPYGGGIPAKDYWRRALSGTILEAMPPLHPTPMPAPSRIVRHGDGPMSNKIEIIACWFCFPFLRTVTLPPVSVSGDIGRRNCRGVFRLFFPSDDDVHRGLWVAFPRWHWLATVFD